MRVSQDMFPPPLSPILIIDIREGFKNLFTESVRKGPKAKKHIFWANLLRIFGFCIPPPFMDGFRKKIFDTLLNISSRRMSLHYVCITSMWNVHFLQSKSRFL